MTKGKTAFAYYGDEPWHKLGQRLDAPTTAAVAIMVAGLNYEFLMLLIPATKTA